MSEQEPSEANGASQTPSLDTIVALVRTSDTFKLVTTGAAAALKKHAGGRETLIARMRDAGPPALGEEAFEELLTQLQDEVDARRALANWLERIAKAPEPGGPPR